jgi:flagellar biosynthesis protein FlhG
MRDQAAMLRDVQRTAGREKTCSRETVPRLPEDPRHGELMVVTSGKGGVGKTVITANMAFLMNRAGKKVLIVDGDIGFADMDVILDLCPSELTGGPPLSREQAERCILQIKPGLDILPAGKGEGFPPRWDDLWRGRFIRAVQGLRTLYDVILVDTGSGISGDVLDFIAIADRVILLLSPDPASFTDAYAMVKTIRTRHRCNNVMVLVNMAERYEEYREIRLRFNLVTSHFLNMEIPVWNCVMADRSVQEAVKDQKILVEEYPRSPASNCLVRISNYLLKESENESGLRMETLSTA